MFSTLYGLPTQAAQVACLRNAVQVNRIEPTRLEVLFARHDPVHQRVTSQHVVAGSSGLQLYPVEVRYVWPSELDVMAQLAGLRLRERWADWRRGPYTGAGAHVSIYERNV